MSKSIYNYIQDEFPAIKEKWPIPTSNDYFATNKVESSEKQGCLFSLLWSINVWAHSKPTHVGHVRDLL